MSSKRHIRQKACTGKIRYESAETAASARYRTARDFGGWFNTYKCKFCKGFHVGHPPKKIKQAMRGNQ